MAVARRTTLSASRSVAHIGEPQMDVVVHYPPDFPVLPTRTPHDDIVDRLDTIIALLEEAADRTLSARLQRVWVWLKGLVR